MNKNVFGLAIAKMFCLVGASTAWAQEIPASLEPPVDQQLYLQVHAQGDQIYVCKSESSQFAWALKAPEAQLTDVKGQAFGRHFGGPTWQAKDGSRVTGTVAMKVESPDADSIPWLLLNVASHEGAGVLSRAKSIQRVNTKGGKAPGSGCDPDHVNQEVRAHYTADYNFYAAK